MGVLQSELFKDTPRLQDCAERDAAHVVLKSPRERGEHVRAIQQALKDLDGATILAAETTAKEYGESTARAVVAYKEKRGIRRSGQKMADNIVGTGTIRKMDEEWLNKKQHSGRLMAEAVVRKQDICMSFEGGTVTRPNDALAALTMRVNTQEYLKTHHPLIGIDLMTQYQARELTVRTVLNRVGELKRHVVIDRILIRGFSSGGKIALMVVNGLYTQLGLRCRYLCVGDAALDKGDPLFGGGAGVAACLESINFYQLWGNGKDTSGETHGSIVGFKDNKRMYLECEADIELRWANVPWDDKLRDKFLNDYAGQCHTCCDGVARRAGQERMNSIMLSPP